ncbi:cell volume regulation protein CvrA [Janibacter sp. HTCC2649]|uniref:potassium/proton antiporter n=1 Tax=Janibacter sp. HTCC2649 TaxID=313589 RepID=UPI0000671079|nr:potassium/proton antiporter [Janibacter sp. HTCC2649]EAP97165.1 cell volume regulation protein CvrA [Janibacter sp. HTCC2649]
MIDTLGMPRALSGAPGTVVDSVTQTLAAAESGDLHALSVALLIGTAVLITAIAAVRLSTRSGLPSLLIYLGIGLALGNRGFGIDFSDEELTQVLGYAALVLILTEGGVTTKWDSIKGSLAPAAALATVGVVVSIAVVAVAAHFVLDMTWNIALLIGAILASTDAAAVFAVLRRVPLPRRISGMLEAESGFNDAPVVILVTAFALQTASSGRLSVGHIVLTVVSELVIGSAIGLAVGWLGGRLMARVAGGSSALFAIGVVTISVLAYAAADVVHASGFIACYLASLVLGNMGLPHRASVLGFSTALGWLAQIGLFVLLGLLADPAGFPSQLIPALVLGLVLLLVARPLSVIVATAPFRMGWRAQAFLSWAGLRGAVPVVLATVPLTVGTEGTEGIFNLVFVLVIIFTLVQAPTLPWVAHRLGLDNSHHSVDLTLETTAFDDIGAHLIEVSVGPTSRLSGVQVYELRLPTGVNVALIVRDGVSFVPKETTPLRRGDQLLVVTPAAVRAQVEKRLYAVSRGGRLAGWSPSGPPPTT